MYLFGVHVVAIIITVIAWLDIGKGSWNYNSIVSTARAGLPASHVPYSHDEDSEDREEEWPRGQREPKVSQGHPEKERASGEGRLMRTSTVDSSLQPRSSLTQFEVLQTSSDYQTWLQKKNNFLREHRDLWQAEEKEVDPVLEDKLLLSSEEEKFPHFPDRKSVILDDNDLTDHVGQTAGDDGIRPPREVLGGSTPSLPVFRETANIQDTLYPSVVGYLDPESSNNNNAGNSVERVVYRDGDTLEDTLYRAPPDRQPTRQPQPQHHSVAHEVRTTPKISSLVMPSPGQLYNKVTTTAASAYSTYSSPLYPFGRPTPGYSSPAPPLPPGYELIPIHQLTPEHEVVPWEELPRLMERSNLTLDSVPLGPYQHKLHGRTTLRPSSLPHTTPYSAVYDSKPYYGSNLPRPQYSPSQGKNFLLSSSYIPPPVSQDMGGIFAPSDHHLYAPKYGLPAAATAAPPYEERRQSTVHAHNRPVEQFLSTARPKSIHFGTHFASDKDANLISQYRYDPTINPAEISNVSPYPRVVTASTAAPMVHIQTTFSSAPRVYPTVPAGTLTRGFSTAAAPYSPVYHIPGTLPPNFSASPSYGQHGGSATPSPTFFFSSSTVPPPTQRPLSILPPPPHFAAPADGLEPPRPPPDREGFLHTPHPGPPHGDGQLRPHGSEIGNR